MSDLPLEATIRTKIIKFINGRPGGAIQIRHQSGYHRKGDPDLTGAYRQLHVEIEVKRPGEKPTELQAQRLNYWQSAGAQVAVLRSESGAEKFLNIIDARIACKQIFSEDTLLIYDDVVPVERKSRRKTH